MKRHLKESFADAGSLPALKPILQSWIDVQERYANAMEYKDYAWWYRERTCIGFLSAAVWQSGGVTLEEWQTEKGPKEQSKHGRCDLYICREGGEFFVEAKHMYSRATGRTKRELHYIKLKLDEAVADARRLQCKRCNQLGILFIAPFYPPGEQDGAAEHISDWLQSVESIPHDAMAWLYQPRHTIKTDRNKWVSPGIVLLARSA